jgi:phage gpG-like protein
VPVTIALNVAGAETQGATLRRWSTALLDMAPAWQEVTELVRQFEVAQFATQGGVERWAPLSPRYGAWKARRYPGKPILVLSGALRKDLTTRPYSVERIEHDSLTLVLTELPYARYHQTGTATMPQRKVLDITREQWDKIVKVVQRHIVAGTRQTVTGRKA